MTNIHELANIRIEEINNIKVLKDLQNTFKNFIKLENKREEIRKKEEEKLQSIVDKANEIFLKENFYCKNCNTYTSKKDFKVNHKKCKDDGREKPLVYSRNCKNIVYKSVKITTRGKEKNFHFDYVEVQENKEHRNIYSMLFERVKKQIKNVNCRCSKCFKIIGDHRHKKVDETSIACEEMLKNIECSICLQKKSAGSCDMVEISCGNGHKTCSECFINIIKYQSTCPFCRIQI